MDQPKSSSRSSAKRDHPQESPLSHGTEMPEPGLPSNPLETNSQTSMSPQLGPRRASSGSSPTMSINLPAAPRRRRVPTKERKRTAMSCDRCKSHKIKVSSLGSVLIPCSVSIPILDHVCIAQHPVRSVKLPLCENNGHSIMLRRSRVGFVASLLS